MQPRAAHKKGVSCREEIREIEWPGPKQLVKQFALTLIYVAVCALIISVMDFGLASTLGPVFDIDFLTLMRTPQPGM